MNIESTAGEILQRGIVFDGKKRYTEALICYQEGLQILINAIKNEADAEKKTYLRSKIEEFMERAERIKKIVSEQKDAGTFHEQVHIDADSVGHSYSSLFGRFFDSDVVSVNVEDPYVRSFHQCQNFLRLCELLVRSCKNLKTVKLKTSPENGDTKHPSTNEQTKFLDMIVDDLKKYNIILSIEYSSTLHDRKISLNSGWIIQIGRGLDIFKPAKNKFSIGMLDMDLRPCHETTVDIFHSKDVKYKF